MTRLCFRSTAGASDANSRHEIIRCTDWPVAVTHPGSRSLQAKDNRRDTDEPAKGHNSARGGCPVVCRLMLHHRRMTGGTSYPLHIFWRCEALSVVWHTCCLLVTFTASTMFASRWDSWASATNKIFLLTSAGSILSSRNSFVVWKTAIYFP